MRQRLVRRYRVVHQQGRGVRPMNSASVISTDEAPLLAVRGVTKIFPGVRALDGVDFTLRRGEIHALMGENGAGKSTLIKVLTGVEHPDKGAIELDGKPV